MISSMTGFGSAEGTSGSARVSAEVRSVNHRFFTPSIKLPISMGNLEGDIRDMLRNRIGRGHVSLSVRIESESDLSSGVNEERFSQALSQLRDLQSKNGMKDEPDLSTVLRMPGVIGSLSEAPTLDPAQVLSTIARAVDALEEMRTAEGRKLLQFLSEHIRIIGNSLQIIAARAPIRLEEQRQRLQRSVQEILGSLTADENRIAQEIAVLADRLDITEELNRFAAHIDAFLKTLASASNEGAGKRLGFILQEMLREANTIGSKANDSDVLSNVVSIKEELERLREQVENVA